MPFSWNSLLYPGLLTGAFGNPMSGMGQLDPFEEAQRARMPYERPNVFKDLPEEYRKSAQRQALMQLAAALGSAPKGYLGGALASGTLGYFRERQGQLENFQNRYDDREQQLGLQAYRESLVENQKRSREASERASLQKHFAAIAERNVAARQIQGLNLPPGEADGLLARLDAGEDAYQVLKSAQEAVRDREEEEKKKRDRELGIEAAVKQGVPRGLAELSAGDVVGEGLVSTLAERQGFTAPRSEASGFRTVRFEKNGTLYIKEVNPFTGQQTQEVPIGPAGDTRRQRVLDQVIREMNDPLAAALGQMEAQRQGVPYQRESFDPEVVRKEVEKRLRLEESVLARNEPAYPLEGGSTGSTGAPEPDEPVVDEEAVYAAVGIVKDLMQYGSRDDAFETWFDNSGLPDSERETWRRRIYSLIR